MAVFAYRAAQEGTTPVRGTITADTPYQARDVLRDRGLTVHDVTEVKPGSQASGLGVEFGFQRGHQGQVVDFIRELATLLAVGVPMLEAMTTIARQCRGGFRQIVLDLHERIASGSSLAEAMRFHPRTFDDFCLNIVEVGESAGTLDASLSRLAEFRERSAQLKGRIATAMFYPCIVLTMALGVSLFLMSYVVPKLLDGLLEAGRPIPWPTRMVKGASDLLIQRWPILLLLALGLSVGVMALYRSRRGRMVWHRAQLRIPLVGELIRKQTVVRVAIIISTLIKSGIVFEKAVRIASRTTRNSVLRGALEQVEAAVHAGRDIAQSLEKTKAFSPTVVQIFAVGEQSGRLEEMLDRLAVNYDQQINTATTRLTALLEPLLIILMVVLVGFIAFATVLPMLEAGNVL